MRKRPWNKTLFLTGIFIYLTLLFFSGLPEVFLSLQPLRQMKNAASLFTRETSLIPGMELFRKKRQTPAKISGECFEVAGGFKTQSICEPPRFRWAASIWETMFIRVFHEIENIEQEKLSVEKRNALAQGLGEFFCKDQKTVHIRFEKSKKLLDGTSLTPSYIFLDYDCPEHKIINMRFSYEKTR